MAPRRLFPNEVVMLLMITVTPCFVPVTGFSSVVPFGSLVRSTNPTRRTGILRSKNDDKQPGMDEAFRQLEALSSLDDPEEYIPAPEKIQFDQTAWRDTEVDASTTAATAAMEQDFAVYKDMVQELELNEDAEAYTDVVKELGGSALQTEDTYTQVLLDMGGTTPSNSSATSTTQNTEPSDGVVSEMDSTPSGLSTEDFMEQALKEALLDVKINNPLVSQSVVLDDKEIMKEIEEIFEQGNAKLMASLEEIRQEQQALAAASATAKAQSVPSDNTSTDAATRYQNAERSMTAMLQRVDAEKANVEQAVTDLKAASEAVDRDVLYQLKRGGLPKQLSLVGFVLFAVRSILDSIASVSTSDESYLLAALVQGAIAIVCAAIFVVLK